MSQMSREKVKDLIERIRSEQDNIGTGMRNKWQWWDKLSPGLKAEIKEIGWPPEIVSQGESGMTVWAKALKQI